MVSTACSTADVIDAAVNANVGGLIISTTKTSAKTPLRVRTNWKKQVSFPSKIIMCNPPIEKTLISFNIVLTTSYSFGNVLTHLLDSESNVTLAINASTSMTQDVTYNIWADTKTGRDNRVIVVGSHLDSVPAGNNLIIVVSSPMLIVRIKALESMTTAQAVLPTSNSPWRLLI